MSEGIQFPLPLIFESRSPEIEPLTNLLEILPSAALIVATDTRRILFANSPLVKITTITHDEFIDQEFKSLFVDLHDDFLIEGQEEVADDQYFSSQSCYAELLRRNQTPLGVQLNCIHLNNLHNRALVFLEPNPLLHSEEELHPRFIQFWKGLRSLIDITKEPDVESALRKVLAAGAILSGVSNLTIYKGEVHNSFLNRQYTIGKEHLFPINIPIEEMMNLRHTDLWASGKRPVTTLQRFARGNNLSYLISSPLGQPNAMVGLLVLAEESAPAQTNTKEITQFLAATLTTIIEYYSQQDKNRSNNLKLESQLRSHSTVEEHLGEGVILLGVDLKILRMNPSSEMMLGYATHEVVGKHVENILIGSESLNPMLQAAQSGSPIYKMNNTRLYRRDGEAFLAMIRAIPVVVDGRSTQIVILLEDLSEQEQMRLKAQHYEQRANVGELTAVFAHEIRNPINNISTGLQALAASLDEADPHQEGVARMLQDCDRLADIIKRVLSLSRPSEYKMDPVDVPLMLKRLLDRLRPRMMRIGVEFDLHADPDCPPVRGDLHALEEIFINLISNAMNVMEQTGGRLGIKVKTVRPPDRRAYLEIAVADTGPGIPPENQERVFTPFFTTSKSGTGLGLAIAKQIVTAHKGNIRLESFPGGTVFYVQIPTILANGKENERNNINR